MADKKISQLTAATTPLDGTEVLPIVQSGSTVKVQNNDLRPKQIQNNSTSGVLQVSNISAAATRVMTVPDADFSAARTDAAQTFTGVNTFVTAGTGTGAPLYVSPTSNAVADVFTGRNLSTGTSAVTRFSLGNNATASGFTITQYGGNHATKANQIQINNEFTSTISISANGGTDNIILASNGNLTLETGNLVQGTAAKGINFTANTGAAGKTSQLLNWYEEGTWTPTAVSGVTMYGPQGWYTRVGNIVYCYGSINTTAITGNITLGGLPFTSANTYTQILGNASFQIVTAGDVSVAQNVSQVVINITGTQSSGAYTQQFAFQYQCA